MGCSNSKAETVQVANPAGKSEPRRNRNRRRRSAEQTSSSAGHQHHPPPHPYDNVGKTENPLQGLLDEAGNAIPLPTRGGPWSFTSDESVFPAGGSETPRASPNRSRAEELEEGPLGNGWTGGIVVIKVIKRKPRRPPSVDDDLSSNSSSNEGDSSPHLQVEAESRGSCEQFQEEESASPRESVVMKPMSPPVHEPGQSSPSTHCPGLTSSSSSSSGSNSEGDSSHQQQ